MGSEELFERAKRVIPGGVNSPVRAFNAVGGIPICVERASGPRLYTADGAELIDFCCSWGPLILGHAHANVVEAVRIAAGRGTSYGTNTRYEVEFAELLCRQVPFLEQVRLVNSGTEATMTALRLARGVTEREKILKFKGCYHGHADTMLVDAGSGLLEGGVASCAGVSQEIARETLVAPYNDLHAVNDIVSRHGTELAAIIVEPVAANMGLVMPGPGFLEGLRKAADRCGAMLVFDEVITGFRLGPTTCGDLYGVTPDLTCLGKIIGGGLPIGAIGGRRVVMEHLAPCGEVYQAGTLSGNPIAVAAGMATLCELIDNDPYPELGRMGGRLARQVNAAAEEKGVPIHCSQCGSMFAIFFRSDPVSNLDSASESDGEAFADFFRHMLDKGIYMPPSRFEVCFISTAHSVHDIERFAHAAVAGLS
jgi:glutamate-1-semialdehyde 2,1-aminomutase